MAGLHHGHARRQGFNHIQPKRLAVERRRAKHIQRSQEGNFFRARNIREELGVGQDTGRREPALLLLDIGYVARPAAPADVELETWNAPALLQLDEDLHGEAQSLDLTHPREVAEHGAAFACWFLFSTFIPLEIDAVGYYPHFVGRNAQTPGHQIAEVTAGSQEEIDLGRALRHHAPRFLPEVRGQSIQKRVLALQHADHRHAQFLLEPPRQAAEQDIREGDDITAMMFLQPGREFIHLPRLMTLLAAQHGNHQLTDVFGARPSGQAAEQFEQPGRSQGVVQPVRGAAEPRDFLFEINIHAAEKNGRARALVGLVER